MHRMRVELLGRTWRPFSWNVSNIDRQLACVSGGGRLRALMSDGILRTLSRTFAAVMLSSEANKRFGSLSLARMGHWLELMTLACRRELPLNKRCSSDQQHEKDRQQYGRYHPLANTEFGDIRHLTASWSRREHNALSHR
jgi:hypothetical protein